MKTFDEFLKDLKPEDLPNEDIQFLASEGGIDLALKVIKEFPGHRFYVPMRALDDYKRKYIRTFCTGSRQDILHFAKELNYTQEAISKALKSPEIGRDKQG
ncbi:MAG: hypothetical protein AB1782_13100 [Cyanobacteriota bacterium]